MFAKKKKEDSISALDEKQKELLREQEATELAIQEIEFKLKQAKKEEEEEQRLRSEEEKRLEIEKERLYVESTQVIPAPDEYNQRKRAESLEQDLLTGKEIRNLYKRQATGLAFLFLLVFAIVSVSLWIIKLLQQTQ